MARTCPHPKQWYAIPWSGTAIYTQHPPIHGRQLAVKWDDWSYTMLASEEPAGPYISKASALYPSGFCEALADGLLGHIGTKPERKRVKLTPRQELTDPLSSSSYSHVHALPKIGAVAQLRGPQAQKKEVDFDGSVGGMRNTTRSTFKVPGHLLIGPQLHDLVNGVLEADTKFETMIFEAIDRKEHDDKYMQDVVNKLRVILGTALGMNVPTDATLAAEYEDTSSVVRDRLLGAWANKAKDPAAFVAEWFRHGAPGGVTSDNSNLGRVWPEHPDPGQELDPDDLEMEKADFANYLNVDNNPKIKELVDAFKKKGYVKGFRTKAQVKQHVGDTFVINNLLVIAKTKYDEKLRKFTEKLRTVLDLKRSGVTKATRLTHKSELPRVTDAITSLCDLLADIEGIR